VIPFFFRSSVRESRNLMYASFHTGRRDDHKTDCGLIPKRVCAILETAPKKHPRTRHLFGQRSPRSCPIAMLLRAQFRPHGARHTSWTSHPTSMASDEVMARHMNYLFKNGTVPQCPALQEGRFCSSERPRFRSAGNATGR
jgi:hypothetical protein